MDCRIIPDQLPFITKYFRTSVQSKYNVRCLANAWHRMWWTPTSAGSRFSCRPPAEQLARFYDRRRHRAHHGFMCCTTAKLGMAAARVQVTSTYDYVNVETFQSRAEDDSLPDRPSAVASATVVSSCTLHSNGRSKTTHRRGEKPQWRVTYFSSYIIEIFYFITKYRIDHASKPLKTKKIS